MIKTEPIKEQYVSPECEALQFVVGSVICASTKINYNNPYGEEQTW